MAASLAAAVPSNIGAHFLRLLESKEMADVTFRVGDCAFACLPRHVLRATAGAGRRVVRIRDMGPAAFGALLHFIYADVLPSNRCFHGSSGMRKAGELLAAAKEHGMERMRLLCELGLPEAVVDAATASVALVLAVRYGYAQLRAVCIDYVASPEVLKDVVGIEEFAEPKASHPVVLVEILEKVAAGLRKEGSEAACKGDNNGAVRSFSSNSHIV